VDHGLTNLFAVFTALYEMQTRSSDENNLSVCLSVRPSVSLSNARIATKQKKDLSRFVYHTKDYLACFFLRRRMFGDSTLSTWIFWSIGPRWSEIANFQPILAHNASAVTPREPIDWQLVSRGLTLDQQDRRLEYTALYARSFVKLTATGHRLLSITAFFTTSAAKCHRSWGT